MPDDFHAYKQNYPPGCDDADVAEHYEGGGEVEGEPEQERFENEPDTSSE